MIRIRCDFNSLDGRGGIRSHVSRADGPIAVGDTVLAWEDDEMSSPMRVVEIFDSGSLRLAFVDEDQVLEVVAELGGVERM